MEFSDFFNRLIPAIVLISGVVVFFTAYLIKYPDFIDFKKKPSTSYGFLLWLIWWATLLTVYFMLPGAGIRQHPIILGILDVGDLALLGFVICYCSGDKDFSWKRLSLLPLSLTILILFYAMMYTSVTPSPLFSLWLVSPSAVLANVAIIMFGWAFLVRWELKALPLFCFTTIYALTQLPAYTAAFVVMPEQYYAQFCSVESFKKINAVFPYLALGKVILAFYPFVLFLSPDGFHPDFSQPKYWPSNEKIPLHPNIRRALLWVLTTIVSLFIGAITRDKIISFVKWLGIMEN